LWEIKNPEHFYFKIAIKKLKFPGICEEITKWLIADRLSTDPAV